MDPRFAIVIPTYNNETTISAVVNAAKAHGHRVFVVNDGSTDHTGASAEAVADGVVNHAVNRGKGAALMTGLAHAAARGFTHVITMDGDGQHDAADLPRLAQAARDAPTAIILGQRNFALMPGKNRFGNRFSNFWVNLAMGQRLGDTQCGFRVYPLDAILARRQRGDGYEFETEVLIRQCRDGQPVVPVAVNVFYPAERVSHFRPRRDATRIVLTVSRFLFLPRGLW